MSTLMTGRVAGEADRRAGRGLPPGVVVLAVLALVVGSLTAGCSSEPDGGLSKDCREVREQFHGWLDSTSAADDAVGHAHAQWANAHAEEFGKKGIVGSELTTVIDAYNADLQTAQAAQAAADQDLARFNEIRGQCSEASMPQGCQDEFAQHAAIIDNATRSTAASVAISQAIAAEQDGLVRGSVTDYNAAVEAQVAAVSGHNDISNEWNATLQPAYSTAISACNEDA